MGITGLQDLAAFSLVRRIPLLRLLLALPPSSRFVHLSLNEAHSRYECIP